MELPKRTYLEWVRLYFGDEIALRFKNNSENSSKMFDVNKIPDRARDVRECIDNAMTWDRTEEGHHFWNKLHEYMYSDLNSYTRHYGNVNEVLIIKDYAK
jgi:hypothetical protein